MGKCMPSIWFKTSNCKIPHWKIFKFLQTISEKIMGKLLFGQFCISTPFPPLNNVEKQWAKLALSYVMGTQHCVGGEGEL